MQTRVLIAVVSCALGLSRPAWSAQTLYPISESNASAPARVHPETSTTNAVPAVTNISVVLKPTATSPTGASGFAQIKDHTVQLHLRRLEPGRYTMQLIMRPNDRIVAVGIIAIVDPTLGPSRQASDNKKEASTNPESVLVETDVQMKVPFLLKPQEVERVVVLGPGANAVLAGEVHNSELAP